MILLAFGILMSLIRSEKTDTELVGIICICGIFEVFVEILIIINVLFKLDLA